MIARSAALVGFLAAFAACASTPAETVTPPTNPQPQPTPAPTPDVAPPKPVAAKAIAQPSLVETPLANDPAKVTIHRLKNGMTVYISPDPQEPNVVAHVAVHAGSSYETPSSTGLAHYLEHMMFKGTSKLGTTDYAKEKPHLDRIAQLYADLRKPNADRAKILKEIDSETIATAAWAIPNELDKLYKQLGVRGMNAFTDHDMTVYVGEFPKNHMKQWARVEAQRYADPVFRLFWPELEAVYEEKNRGLDNPGRRVNEALFKAMFPKHAYGYSTTIGEVEHLKSPAYGDMVDFFHRFYTPKNMAIVLSGDVDDSIIPMLDEEFAAFQREAGDASVPGPITELHGRTQIDVPVPAHEGVVLAWSIPKANAADRLAVEVMDDLVFDGRSGILQRELLLPQKVAGAGSNPDFLREAGVWQLYADSLTGQKQDELEKLLLGVVAKLQNGDFSDADLKAAVLSKDIAFQRNLESNGGRENMMEDAFLNDIEWKDYASRSDRMKKLTKADIVAAAKKYLTSNYLVVRKVIGQAQVDKIDKPGISPVPTDASRVTQFQKDILAMPSTPIEPVALADGKDYARAQLATGPLVTVENKRNKLFTLSFDYDTGRRDDRLTCFALGMLPVSGAGKLNADQLHTKLHELGISVDTSCGKETSSVIVSGLDANLEAGMELVTQMLGDSSFDDATLKASVATELTDRDNTLKSPQAVPRAQVSYAQYGEDNDYLVVASNKALGQATPAQLKKLLGQYLHLTHKTSYFGPRSAADAAKIAVLGDGKAKPTARHTIKYRAPNTVIATDVPKLTQTHVNVFWPHGKVSNADRAAGSVYSEYIGLMLYQEVREARGLAYTVYGGYSTGRKVADDTAMYTYVGTQSDKTNDAIDAMLGVMKAPLEDARLVQAKAALAEAHRVERIAPRAIAGYVWAWDDQGEKSDPREARYQRAAAVDKAVLEKWLKGQLGGKIIVSVVGNKARFDEKKIAALAPITWVPVEKLFGY